MTITTPLNKIPAAKRLVLGRPWDDIWLGGMVAGSITLLGGPCGAGKTTMAVQVASTIARLEYKNGKRKRTAVYIASDPHSGAAFIEMAARLGVSDCFAHGNVESEASLMPFLYILRHEVTPTIVILDTVGALVGQSVIKTRKVFQYLEMYRGTEVPVLLLCDTTRNGDYQGPMALQNYSDTLITIWPPTEPKHGQTDFTREVTVWKTPSGLKPSKPAKRAP